MTCPLDDSLPPTQSHTARITFNGSTYSKLCNSICIDCTNIVPCQDYHLCCKNLHLIFLGNFGSAIRVSLSTTRCIYCSQSQNANYLSREAAVLLLSKIISFHSETQEWPFTFLEGQRKNLEDINTIVYSPTGQILSLKPITLDR